MNSVAHDALLQKQGLILDRLSELEIMILNERSISTLKPLLNVLKQQIPALVREAVEYHTSLLRNNRELLDKHIQAKMQHEAVRLQYFHQNNALARENAQLHQRLKVAAAELLQLRQR